MKKSSPRLAKRKERLDHIALDIEFLLISVIQGVALVTLATSAMGPLTLLQFQIWPYIAVAFLFILIFWSGAIIHAVSFIDWPTDLIHSFLYFLASIIEIVALTNLAHPLLWFLFLFIFQLVAMVLYLYDLYLIKQHKSLFFRTLAGRKLYEHIVTMQQKELRYYIPASFLLFFISFLAIYLQPQLFIVHGYNEVLIVVQLLFALAFLWNEVKTFQKRSKLLQEYV